MGNNEIILRWPILTYAVVPHYAPALDIYV